MPSMRIGTTLREDAAPTMPHMEVLALRVGFRRLHGALPAMDRDLLRAGHGERAGGRVLRAHANRADPGARAHGDRRDKQSVGGDARTVAADRLVAVCA